MGSLLRVLLWKTSFLLGKISDKETTLFGSLTLPSSPKWGENQKKKQNEKTQGCLVGSVEGFVASSWNPALWKKSISLRIIWCSFWLRMKYFYIQMKMKGSWVSSLISLCFINRFCLSRGLKDLSLVPLGEREIFNIQKVFQAQKGFFGLLRIFLAS